MSKHRVNAVDVRLIQLLGSIIRNNLGFKVAEMTECWTFMYISNWTIEAYHIIEHDQSLCFGSGYFMKVHEDGASEPEKIEVRAACELSQWIPAGQHYWTFRLWFKHPDGQVKKYYFRKFSFSNSINNEAVPEDMRDAPPKRISFKKESSTVS